VHISEPDFPRALCSFIYTQNHPGQEVPEELNTVYDGSIDVFHSATACFFSPSDLCGAGGMYRHVVRATPSFRLNPRYDTVLVDVGAPEEEMKGLLVARVLLFFSYYDHNSGEDVPCALARWFVHPDDKPQRDEETGLWTVIPEEDEDGAYAVQVISLDSILRGIRLLPCYGDGFLPLDITYKNALDVFNKFYVNQYIDYHAHELLA
jgi:hypothetical protein